ncbi:YceD family protein [Paenibacillus eucommiae]|uniref:DUF177 domain-containing protein n=1 Tax=Paenibacillus eucommiae TaxID=1355755 RepID=A0ABS4IUY3_9BACL|nr:DUF177 domain-containing protein [Paenibacillus eucommiae]MBP1991382.1 uncharacterized protein [Paenibacillus eucommiae]
MQINMKDLALRGQTVAWKEDLQLNSAFEGRADILAHSAVHVDLHAKPIAGAVEVRGKLTLDLDVSCARCLSHVKQTLELPFLELFTQNRIEAEDGNPDELPEDVHLVTEDKVELEPYVIENVVMGLPYIPLCDDACKGLCPECGVNRNLQDCGCNREKLDPRLAGLADLFKEK